MRGYKEDPVVKLALVHPWRHFDLIHYRMLSTLLLSKYSAITIFAMMILVVKQLTITSDLGTFQLPFHASSIHSSSECFDLNLMTQHCR